MSLFKYLKL